jgi:hypothetical protein
MSPRSGPLDLCAALLACVVCMACTAKTGTTRLATAQELAQAKSIAVSVQVTESFSVRRSREAETNSGAAMFGLIGAVVESSARAVQDSSSTKAVVGGLGDFDPKAELARRIVAAFKDSRTAGVTSDASPAALQQQGFDSVLEVTVREWGLRLCNGAGPQTVQGAYAVDARLRMLDSSEPIWQRTDLYLDRECQVVEAFQSADLLRTVLARAADSGAKRLVNDILFP